MGARRYQAVRDEVFLAGGPPTSTPLFAIAHSKGARRDEATLARVEWRRQLHLATDRYGPAAFPPRATADPAGVAATRRTSRDLRLSVSRSSRSSAEGR